jgi:L-threonylcarbamoyladenylate synthase
MRDSDTKLDTHRLKIDPITPEPELIAFASDLLKSGGVLVFPTDTVYGIGILVQETATLDSIYKIKQRDQGKAIPLLVDGIDCLQRYGLKLPGYALELAQEYWPGSLTLIVEASAELPKQFVAADGTIALRMPNSKIVLELLGKAGLPIATSSANLQGQAPAAAANQITAELETLVDLIIDSGSITNAQPSTIISCLGDKPIMIRRGTIPLSF